MQLYFGLDKFLPYFDFVGDFGHVREHSEELLRHVGLWDEFGATGWGPKGKNGFFQRCGSVCNRRTLRRTSSVVFLVRRSMVVLPLCMFFFLTTTRQQSSGVQNWYTGSGGRRTFSHKH